jgi:hypothetical protein
VVAFFAGAKPTGKWLVFSMAPHVKMCLSYHVAFWFQNLLDTFFIASTMSWAAFDVDGEGNLEVNATGGRPPSLGTMLIMQQVQKVLVQKETEDAMEAESSHSLTTQDTTNKNEEKLGSATSPRPPRALALP